MGLMGSCVLHVPPVFMGSSRFLWGPQGPPITGTLPKVMFLRSPQVTPGGPKRDLQGAQKQDPETTPRRRQRDKGLRRDPFKESEARGYCTLQPSPFEAPQDPKERTRSLNGPGMVMNSLSLGVPKGHPGKPDTLPNERLGHIQRESGVSMCAVELLPFPPKRGPGESQ